MKRLSSRLFLAMGLLAVASVASVSLWTRQATRYGLMKMGQLEEVELQRSIAAFNARLELAEGHESRAKPRTEELQRLVDLVPGFRGAALIASDGTLIAGVGLPADDLQFEVFPEEARAIWEVDGKSRVLVLRSSVRIQLEPEGLAVLVPFPAQRPGEFLAKRQDVLGGIDHGVWVAGASVILLAILMSAILARRIVRPLVTLTDAVRELAVGDLARRVETRGQDELAELGKAFNEMAASLEHSEALRQRMVTDVAHELRTPLTVLQGRVEAAQDDLIRIDRRFLATLHDDIRHLSSLVSDLQDLALAEAGQLALELEALDTGEELRRLCRSLGLNALSEPSLVLDLATGLCVRADSQRFRQIFQNLLENARTHAPHGQIVLSSRSTSAGVEVTVTDDGAGIAAADLPNIFNRFYRADESRQRPTGGQGLGLGIVQQLTHLHGGQVSVQSELGQGAQFRIVLPPLPQKRWP